MGNLRKTVRHKVLGMSTLKVALDFSSFATQKVFRKRVKAKTPKETSAPLGRTFRGMSLPPPTLRFFLGAKSHFLLFFQGTVSGIKAWLNVELLP